MAPLTFVDTHLLSSGAQTVMWMMRKQNGLFGPELPAIGESNGLERMSLETTPDGESIVMMGGQFPSQPYYSGRVYFLHCLNQIPNGCTWTRASYSLKTPRYRAVAMFLPPELKFECNRAKWVNMTSLQILICISTSINNDHVFNNNKRLEWSYS